MRKALLLSMAAVVSAAAVGVGGTFALFSDQKSGSAIIDAGNLCISSYRDAGDTVPGPMFYMTAVQGATPDGTLGRFPLAEVGPTGHSPDTPGGWAPGDTVMRTLTVFNGDPQNEKCYKSLEAKVTHITASLQAGSDEALAAKMYVTVEAQKPGGGMDIVAQGYLSEFLTKDGLPLLFHGSGLNPVLPEWLVGQPQPNIQVQFTVHFEEDTPNAYQKMSMIVDFAIHAEQTAHNP